MIAPVEVQETKFSYQITLAILMHKDLEIIKLDYELVVPTKW